jgi:hypothetical protein
VIFYLTFPKQNAFALVPAGVPLFVNRNALFGKESTYARTGKLPRARGPWALDSGGFTELTTHGRWTITPTQYIREVRECVAQVGAPDFAATLDWMTEDVVLERTGGTVEQHQERTLESYLQLRHDGGPDLAHLWLPVLQGAHDEDYVRHFEEYLRHGLDLRRANVVGVGSVCRRHEDQRLVGIFGLLHDLGLRRLHGFGVKQTGVDWPVKVKRPRFSGTAHDQEAARQIAETLDLAWDRGFPIDVAVAWLMEHPGVGAVTWEEEERRVCDLLHSADSNAWSDRARKWAHAVTRSRDAALGPGWKVKGGVLLDARGAEVGQIRHELALSGTPGPLHPRQATPECSGDVAAGARGAGSTHGRTADPSCVSCPRWALAYRERLRVVLEPLGCWQTASTRRQLPPLDLGQEHRDLTRAAELQERWRRYGPGHFGFNPPPVDWPGPTKPPHAATILGAIGL